MGRAPTAQLERVALCAGWDACDVPPPDASALADQATIIFVPPDRIGAGVPISVLHFRDRLLNDVDQLLFTGLVDPGAPVALCVEALLYSYLFTHHQGHFAGRLDRVFDLDGGRCAELIVAAAERAYPRGDYGHDEWARMYADPTASAARAFLRPCSDTC